MVKLVDGGWYEPKKDEKSQVGSLKHDTCKVVRRLIAEGKGNDDDKKEKLDLGK